MQTLHFAQGAEGVPALLQQLVEQRAPQVMREWLLALRNWRRWLVRIGELNIQPPDPVLLLATLDRFSMILSKNNSQVAFRLQVSRAALKVDILPTAYSVQQFAEALQAEGEAAALSGAQQPKEVTKVKALDSKDKPKDIPKDQKPDGPKDKSNGKDGGKSNGNASCPSPAARRAKCVHLPMIGEIVGS